MTRALYFGDDLDVLRESIADECVDLIYLDPPFNSQRSYNLLFCGPKGRESDAQITAFEDTWHWGQQEVPAVVRGRTSVPPQHAPRAGRDV
jgi:site-specific DNA-methyltransferase (adenine-specific)